MFTVIGAGFGIYGYVPALVEAFDEPVVLPLGYQDLVMARPELEPYRGSIRWAADAAEALQQASGAVIAVPPLGQPEVAVRCCAAANLKMLVLEKPLAATPMLAADVLNMLERSRKRYRIGYTLLNAPWLESLRWPAGDAASEVRIDWTFMAHHFSRSLRNWKRLNSQGGGVLRFFGIHLVALLAHYGYDSVVESRLIGLEPDEPHAWRARFSGKGLPECVVNVDSRSNSDVFSICTGKGKQLVGLKDPFDSIGPASPSSAGDRRVPVLVRLLRTFSTEDEPFCSLYRRSNELWKDIEAR